MTGIAKVGFRGYEIPADTVKQAKQCPAGHPDCDQVHFRGELDEDKFEKQGTGKKVAVTVLSLATIAALLIGGGGALHKYKGSILEKLGNKEWLNKGFDFIEPATKKCHDWCSVVKTKGIECLDTVKGFFKKSADDAGEQVAG